MRFKKGTLTTEAYKILMHDLESIEISMNDFNKYHYDLLVGNLKDIFGINDEEVK